MLDAAVHKKLRATFRDDIFEDLITSGVFGPLQYMPSADAWCLVKQLLLDPQDDPPSNPFCPETHSLDFWPRYPVDDVDQSGQKRRTSVEPDLVFKFVGSDKSIVVVLLEVKWGAALMPDQLNRQIRAARARHPGATFHQVLLAKIASNGDTKKQLEETGCKFVPWATVGTTKIATQNGWLNSVSRLLEFLGQVPFSSFAGYFSLPQRVGVGYVLRWRCDQWAMSPLPWCDNMSCRSDTMGWRIG